MKYLTIVAILILFYFTFDASAACSNVTCADESSCCTFTPYGSPGITIDACYNPANLTCMQDEGESNRTCLCATDNGCFNSVCYDKALYQLVPDKKKDGSRCVCKKDPVEYCHNSQCFVDPNYDTVFDPVLNEKKNCPQNMFSCDFACFDTSLYTCCVAGSGIGYLEQQGISCREGYEEICQGPYSNTRELTTEYKGFNITSDLQTCNRSLAMYNSTDVICSVSGSWTNILYHTPISEIGDLVVTVKDVEDLYSDISATTCTILRTYNAGVKITSSFGLVLVLLIIALVGL